MKRKHRKIWINKVFDEVKEIEKLLHEKISYNSLSKEDIDHVIDKIHMHYDAINSLKMSFNPKTFFTGYLKE